MIRVEQDMLVLDSTISKKDVQAINEFLEITKRQERERIIKLLERNATTYLESPQAIEFEMFDPWNEGIMHLIALIKGEK
jgi:hypothetical protein